jgi:hypothetical protein
MMQTELQRRAYLRAMGIDVWIPRDQADTAPDTGIPRSASAARPPIG